MASGSCDSCSNYVYDEDYEDYMCMVSMDEDEAAMLIQGHRFECPYYSYDNEYAIVKHQM